MGLLLIDQLARSDNQAAIQLLLLFLVVLLFLSESGPGQVRSGPGTMHSMPCELISRMFFSLATICISQISASTFSPSQKESRYEIRAG